MSDNYSTSRKRLVMAEVLRLCRDLRGGRYHVRRGAINWGAHDFSAVPFAISVHCDDGSFLRGEGNNEATLSLEIMTRIPGPHDEIDDILLDDIVDDAATVFERLEEATEDRDQDGIGDGDFPVVMRVDRTRDSAIEVSDQSRSVQGIVATTSVTF